MREVTIGIFFIVFHLMPIPPAVADEIIKGAFGISLGQVFDPREAIGRGSLTDGTPMYQFNPQNKFRSFSDYYVLITPKSHKVYEIWAIGNINNKAKCEKDKKLLLAILSDKYGEPKEQNLASALFDADIITQGDRRIITQCSGIFDVQIKARYVDVALEELAENERIDLEKQKLDSSGL